MGVGSWEWEVGSGQCSVFGGQGKGISDQGKGISDQSQFSVSVSVSVFSLIHLNCESVAKNQRIVCLAVKQLLYVF